MELIAGIAAYALQDGIKNLLADKINATMHQYEKNDEARSAIDFLQSRVIFQFLNISIVVCQNYEFVKHLTNVVYIIEYIIQQLYCCGYNGYEDWEAQEMTIPSSCPSRDNENIYVTGCIKHLSIIIHRSALYIGTGAVAIALIQVSIYYIYS